MNRGSRPYRPYLRVSAHLGAAYSSAISIWVETLVSLDKGGEKERQGPWRSHTGLATSIDCCSSELKGSCLLNVGEEGQHLCLSIQVLLLVQDACPRFSPENDSGTGCSTLSRNRQESPDGNRSASGATRGKNHSGKKLSQLLTIYRSQKDKRFLKDDKPAAVTGNGLEVLNACLSAGTVRLPITKSLNSTSLTTLILGLVLLGRS